ncbi:MAG: oligosaccharide flippase family protein [Thermoproteota archaeon]
MSNNSKEFTKAFSVAKTAVEGGFYVFTGNTLSTIVLVVASITIARLLGPSGYGLYSVALIPPSFMLLFTDFGVNQALVRFLAKLKSEGKEDDIQILIRTGLFFEVLTSTLVFLLTFMLADFLATYLLNRPDSGSLVRLASLTVVGGILVSTSNSILVGTDRMNKSALLSLTQAVFKALLTPMLILAGFSVAGAVVGHTLSYLIAGVVGVVTILRISGFSKRSSNVGFSSSLVSMIKYGFPLYASAFVAGLLTRYQSIVLTWFTSNAEIGNYYVATMFSAAVNLLIFPISTVLFPAFSKIDPKNEQKDLKILFSSSLKYTLLLVVPASMFVTFNSKALVMVFYGSSYTLAPFYAALYSTTFLYAGFSLVLMSFFSGIGRTDISLKVTLVQLPAIVLVTPILTLFFKVQGFIVSLIVSSTISLAYIAFIAYNKYELRFDFKSIVRIFVASFVSSVVTLPITLYLPSSYLIKLILSSVVFIFSYLTIAPIVGAIEQNDVKNLISITKDIKLISKLSKVILSYEEYLLIVKIRQDVKKPEA